MGYRLVITAIIFGIIFLMKTSDSHAQSASLNINPASQTVNLDSIFTVEIRVNTGGESINTVAAHLTFDNTILTPQTIDTSGSFVSIWFENNITSSEVRLIGSVPSPGVSGDNLLFARVNFLADSASTTQIAFTDDSAVFRASDNVDILGDAIGSVITVSSVAVTPTPGNTTPTPTIPGAETGSPTPTSLPDAGIVTPTLVLFALAILLFIVAIVLLV